MDKETRSLLEGERLALATALARMDIDNENDRAQYEQTLKLFNNVNKLLNDEDKEIYDREIKLKELKIEEKKIEIKSETDKKMLEIEGKKNDIELGKLGIELEKLNKEYELKLKEIKALKRDSWLRLASTTLSSVPTMLSTMTSVVALGEYHNQFMYSLELENVACGRTTPTMSECHRKVGELIRK